MPQEFKIEIISPDKTVFLGSAEEVLLPCYEGQITVLKDHIPLITFLRPGVIKIGKNEEFYVEDGTVEFSDNNLIVLSTSVQSLKKIKSGQISEMLKDAEKKVLSSQISDKQKYILN